MAFLITRVDQTVAVYWTRDPAIKSKKAAEDEPEIIRADTANGRIKRTGTPPDRFTVRPLNNREFLGLGAIGSDAHGMAYAACEMCSLGITKIDRADGSIIDDEEEIRRIINEGVPPEFISAMSQFIVDLTTSPGGQKKT